jgi:DNA mismatch repair ATPase MutS
VGRVEEMPAAPGRAGSSGSSSKLLVRQLVRIYTPGTAVEGLLLDDQVTVLLLHVARPGGGKGGGGLEGGTLHPCHTQV